LSRVLCGSPRATAFATRPSEAMKRYPSRSATIRASESAVLAHRPIIAIRDIWNLVGLSSDAAIQRPFIPSVLTQVLPEDGRTTFSDHVSMVPSSVSFSDNQLLNTHVADDCAPDRDAWRQTQPCHDGQTRPRVRVAISRLRSRCRQQTLSNRSHASSRRQRNRQLLMRGCKGIGQQGK